MYIHPHSYFKDVTVMCKKFGDGPAIQGKITCREKNSTE